ncbi:YueI family protein [Lacticaseibacillus zhaodongensis]|uniref:YueI family protein n=1 Tax=Lacticaseibacillus zhaodongensis TaxID=2668065 RepID=UPI0012D2FAC5|nr:YueI family protein [Lacticaseibacillus zhaodongensis]
MADNDNNNVQDHLTNAIFGARVTKPDERRHYLGSLRERVELRLTNHDMAIPSTVRRFRDILPQYENKDLSVLINGKQGNGITGPYVKLCAENSIPFTLINNDNAQLDPDANGLLIVARTAVNQENIDLPPLPEAPKKKTGWFHSLFQ